MNSAKRIFSRNVTVLDCAILISGEVPHGKSWYVDVIWEGSIDDTGVVFDFSLAKKSAKKAIDDLFDHRLFVPLSCVQEATTSRVVVVSQKENSVEFAMDSYLSGVTVFSDVIIEALSQNNTKPLCRHLAEEIKKNAPANVQKVEVVLRDHEEKHKENYFSYTHSLRKHYGNCQRFHGHSNVIEVINTDAGTIETLWTKKAADYLRGKYLVSEGYLKNSALASFKKLANYLPVEQTNLATIQYTGSQGEVSLMIPKENLCILPDESTIENIADLIRQKLEVPEAYQIHAYEGLQKGALG